MTEEQIKRLEELADFAKDIDDSLDWKETAEAVFAALAELTTLRAQVSRAAPLMEAAVRLHKACNAPPDLRELDNARDRLLQAAHAFARTFAKTEGK